MCSDETAFLVKAGVTAKLLEVNESLLKVPELLKKEGLGFIAILSPRASGFDKQMNELVSAEEYNSKLNERPH